MLYGAYGMYILYETCLVYRPNLSIHPVYLAQLRPAHARPLERQPTGLVWGPCKMGAHQGSCSIQYLPTGSDRISVEALSLAIVFINLDKKKYFLVNKLIDDKIFSILLKKIQVRRLNSTVQYVKNKMAFR